MPNDNGGERVVLRMETLTLHTGTSYQELVALQRSQRSFTSLKRLNLDLPFLAFRSLRKRIKDKEPGRGILRDHLEGSACTVEGGVVQDHHLNEAWFWYHPVEARPAQVPTTNDIHRQHGLSAILLVADTTNPVGGCRRQTESRLFSTDE
jgi:hypothetical protein